MQAAAQLRRLSCSMPSQAERATVGEIASGLISREASAQHGDQVPQHVQALAQDASLTSMLVDASSLQSLHSLQPGATHCAATTSAGCNSVARSVSFKRAQELAHSVHDGNGPSHYTGAPAQKPASRSASLIRIAGTASPGSAGHSAAPHSASNATLLPPMPQAQVLQAAAMAGSEHTAATAPEGSGNRRSPCHDHTIGVTSVTGAHVAAANAWQVQHDAVARGAYGSHNVHPDQHLQFLAPGDTFVQASRSVSPWRNYPPPSARWRPRPVSAGARLSGAEGATAHHSRGASAAETLAWVPPGATRGTFNRAGAEQAATGICNRLGISCVLQLACRPPGCTP